jgi:hypothetical protein
VYVAAWAVTVPDINRHTATRVDFRGCGST